MTTPRLIEATATREGKWWFIRIPELGTATQARTLREIDLMASDVAALWLSVDPEEVEVRVAVELPAAVREIWERAKEKQAHAKAEETEAATLSRDAVRALRSNGITLADAGTLLGLSPQRVHQLSR
jgi:predicted RNase H-like HicB family nuclease